jgi:hypothetical protein
LRPTTPDLQYSEHRRQPEQRDLRLHERLQQPKQQQQHQQQLCQR